MSFYQQLSHYYDQLFTFDATELAFIAKELGPAPRLLDIGCATGNKTAMLSSLAESIVAIDADATMISLARANHPMPNIKYDIMDMRLLAEKFFSENFDAVLCLGNTLVHVEPLSAINKMLEDISFILAKNGRLMLQILNYDRILDQQITSLPDIDTEQVLFTRGYSWESKRLMFNTSLRIKANGEEFKNSIPLYPLRRQALQTMLEDAGFGKQSYFGGFHGEAYNSDAALTIVVADK